MVGSLLQLSYLASQIVRSYYRRTTNDGYLSEMRYWREEEVEKRVEKEAGDVDEMVDGGLLEVKEEEDDRQKEGEATLRIKMRVNLLNFYKGASDIHGVPHDTLTVKLMIVHE